MSIEIKSVKPFRLPPYTFGVEIECIGGRTSRTSVISRLRSEGFSVSDESHVSRYNDSTWVIGYDGSIDGNNGIEIKSPILKGAEGLAAIKRFTKVLNDLHITVNQSCGLHVHVGIKNATRKFRVDEIYTILKRYQTLKPEIDLLLARSRRSGHNDFCQDVDQALDNIEYRLNETDLKLRDLLSNSETRAELADCGDHYDAASLYALCTHGTLEFRQHHGTVNGTKITNWVRFLLNFIEVSRLIAKENRKAARKASKGREPVRRARVVSKDIALPELPKSDDIFSGQLASVVKHFQEQKARLATSAGRHTRGTFRLAAQRRSNPATALNHE